MTSDPLVPTPSGPGDRPRAILGFALSFLFPSLETAKALNIEAHKEPDGASGHWLGQGEVGDGSRPGVSLRWRTLAGDLSQKSPGNAVGPRSLRLASAYS